MDAEGRRYVDYIGSWGPMILGHGHPAVLDAVLKRGARRLRFGAPTEREVELAEEIIRHVPSVEQVRLVSSGTEACMSAIRLARAATGRSRLVKFEGCYHGHADALLVKAGSGLATFGHPTSAGVPPEVVQHTTVLDFNNVERLEEAFAAYGDELACVIIEPIAGNMNFVRASVPFMKRLRELCLKHGALLIMDEVMTGFRVALGGAQASRPADRRLRARHQRLRQGHRRRHAAGGLRRLAQDHGAARAAGPGLPGRHAVGQPGGHRLRPRHAAQDRQARLPRGAGRPHPPAGRRAEGGRRRRRRSHVGRFARAACSALRRRGAAARLHGAVAVDKERFNRFFHAMLVAGCIRTALYQAGFVAPPTAPPRSNTR